jgi:hypothetical protein
MRFLMIVIALGLLAPLSRGAAAEPPAAGKPAFDSTYLVDDFVNSLVVQPRILLKNPSISKTRLDNFLASWEAFLGFDPRKLDEIVLATGPKSDTFGLILRNSVPFDRARFPAHFRGMEARAFEGKPYFVDTSADEQGPEIEKVRIAYALPNAQTLVISQEVRLKKMLTAGRAKTVLTSYLAKADMSRPVHLVWDEGQNYRRAAILHEGQQLQLGDRDRESMRSMALAEVSLDTNLAIEGLFTPVEAANTEEVRIRLTPLLRLVAVIVGEQAEKGKDFPPDLLAGVRAGQKRFMEMELKKRRAEVVMQIEGDLAGPVVASFVELLVRHCESLNLPPKAP